MFSNETMENDAAKQALQQRYRKASETWHFRDVKSTGSQGVVAILTGLLTFFVR